MLTPEQKRQAIIWYAQGYDLVTIAQHYGLTRDELAREIRTEKPKETVTPNKRTQEQTAQHAKQYAASNGGREYTHRVDGVSQYPDLKEFTPQNMTAFTIVVNLEMRKHS